MTKTITIRDAVYHKLSKIKREGESFSELFDRLVEGVDPLHTLKGLRGRVAFEDKDKVLEEIYAARGERRP